MPISVMIIDDEPNLRANLAAFMDDEGLEVRTAGSGEEALTLLAENGPVDVCIMDMRLPGMDGNDTIRAVHSQYPQIQFVVHTGSAAYSLPDDLRAFGMTSDVVFRKPLEDMSVLAIAVKRAGERGAHA